MRKGGQLSWKDFLILIHLRQFPYLSRKAISNIHFGTRYYDGSYPDKVLRKLESRSVGLIRRVWTGLNTWAYAITPKGVKTVELALKDDWESLRKRSEANSKPKSRKPEKENHKKFGIWIPPFHSELEFKLLSEKKIAYNFPKEHTMACARFWWYYKKPHLLLFTDLLKPKSKNSLGLKSTPDFIDLDLRVAFEIENTVASPSRKYQKIKNLYRDRNRMKFFVFLFPDESHLDKYLTKEGWYLFLNKEYTPVGKPAYFKVKYVDDKQLTFATRRMLFGVQPKGKGQPILVKRYKEEFAPLPEYLAKVGDSNFKVAPDE